MNFGQDEAFFFANGGRPRGTKNYGLNVMVPYKKMDVVLVKPWREILVSNAVRDQGEVAGRGESAWNRAYLQNYDQVFNLNIDQTITSRDGSSTCYAANPDRTLTLAGCARIAAMTHSLYKKDNESFTLQPGEAWYMPYVRYAVKEGIIPNAQTVTSNPNKVASRLELLRMLYNSVPATAWKVKSQYTMPADVASLTDTDKAIIQAMSQADVLAGTETSVVGTAFNYRTMDANVNPWKMVTVQDAAIWTSRMMAEYVY